MIENRVRRNNPFIFQHKEVLNLIKKTFTGRKLYEMLTTYQTIAWVEDEHPFENVDFLINNISIYSGLSKNSVLDGMAWLEENDVIDMEEEDEDLRLGFVYLMSDSTHVYTKIGYSKQPEFREKTLQAQKPVMDIFYKTKGNRSDEIGLHDFFAEKRFRGEWFDLTKKDIKYIKSLTF